MVDREGGGAAEGVDGTDYLTRRRGSVFERLRISRMSRMVDREGDGAAEGVEGTDYLTRRRGLYMKDYEFLECHEWLTEMETVQAKGWRGLII